MTALMRSRTSPLQRSAALLTALATFAVQVALPPMAEASHLGSSTASAGSVAPPNVTALQSFQPDLFTGRATTSIPIAVPPGRKGMQPSLALSYSSSARNGWLGVGWNLDLGYIERSTKTGVPKYDSTDTYTFMFQGVNSDLVQIPGGTYRAKDEGLFLKFESKGVSGWEVRDKSGTVYFFGQTAASQIEETGKTFRWCLDKVRDANGNTMFVSYSKDSRQTYVSQIRYTGHEPSGLAPANQVDFTLEDRSDEDVTFRPGFEVRTKKRLKLIETKATVGAGLSPARSYELTYAASGRTGRSVLSSVTQIGTDGVTALPATAFTYQDSAAPTYQLSSNTSQAGSPIWNVRAAALDTGHDNNLPCHPFLSVPWSAPVIQASGSIGGVSFNSGGDGSFSVSFGQDNFFHAWTWVYNTSTVSIPTFGADVGCMWIEDAGSGLRQAPGSGSVTLNPGWTVVHLTGYHQHEGRSMAYGFGLKNAVSVMNPTQFIKPQLAGDADGNSVTDLITFDATAGSWAVSSGQNFAASPGKTWLAGFGGSATIPLLGDWDSDGQTDIGTYQSGNWQFALSDGTQFTRNSARDLTFGSGTPLTGDFNGDGSVDIGTYSSGNWSVALSQGGGFSSAASFYLPSWGSDAQDPLTGDFNGDGLTDIAAVTKVTGSINVALSNGSAFVPQPVTWIPGFGPNQPHTSADFNGDGLTDVAVYDKSSGQVLYAASTGSSFLPPIALPATFSMRGSSDELQLGDFNGDGLPDPAIINPFSNSSEIARSQGSAPDLLTEIRNGLGGKSTLTYQASTQCDNTCPIEGIPKLPFVLHVVSRVTTDDGMGQSYTGTYVYKSGRYDAPSKEFRGFARVEARDSDANVTITEFHQDDHRKGRPFKSELRDASDTLWTQSEQTWTCTEPYPGVHFAKLDETRSTTYGGDATSKQVAGRFIYDSYGNVTETHEDGEVAVTGDERHAVTAFTYDTAAWMLSKPSEASTLAADGTTVLAKRQFTYDAKGNLTQEKEWLNLPTEQWLTTSLTYDTYGNVLTVTDAKLPTPRTTTNTYDANGTFLTKITNALSHSRELTYDPRSGQVLSSKDQNGIMTTTEYDALGRVRRVIGPNDSAQKPTIAYEYALNPTPPSRTTVHTRVQSGQDKVLTVYAFTDGLGRTIQTRSPAEDPAKQVVSGAVELNTRGQVIKQWAPYLDTTATSYVPHTTVTGLAQPVQYEYDVLGRLTKTLNPDGSTAQTVYDDWAVTTIDGNGNQTRRTQDAAGRLTQVEEFLDGQTHTTRYEYDGLSNLAKVTDAQNNITTIGYDSLGRKLSMDDPDMGHWEYRYDEVDNLTSQTDARGVVTAFTYDQLNRLKTKAYTIPAGSGVAATSPVTYFYDEPNTTNPATKGKLTRVQDGSGESKFEYDTLGRLIKETKTIDSTPYPIQRSYDLLGRITSLIYPDDEETQYAYNDQGGIETVKLKAVGGALQSVVNGIEYNAAGQLTKITYGNGVTTDYSYNPQTLQLDRLHSVGPTGNLQDFRYSFDPAGNVTQIQDLVHTGGQSFEYDGLNRLVRATGIYGDLRYTYDPIGNMLEKEGVAMQYGAGSAGPHAVTSTAAGWAMTYDANGSMVEKAITANPGVKELTKQFMQYDAENRLVQVETAQEETVSVTFKPGWNFFALPVIPDDGAVTVLLPTFAQDFEQIAKFEPATQTFKHYVGNPKFDEVTELEYGVGYQIYCKSQTDLTISFKGKVPTRKFSKSLPVGWHLLPATGLADQPTSQAFAGVDTVDVRGYGAGALTATTTAKPGQAYWVNVRTASTWSPALPKNVTASHVYDGDGGKAKQITASGTTLYVGEVLEKDSTGKTTKYLFAGSQRIAAKESTGELLFYHTDHLGSSNVVTNASGTLVEHTEHLPFGAVHTHTGAKDLPHKFTGQRQDSGSGLVLFPARAYDPELGRFLQADSFVQAPADPQSLNRYAYVRNNPINLVDPSGYKWSWKAFFGIVAAVALVIATAGAAAPGVAAAAGAYGAAEIAAGTLASWATTAAVISAASGAAYLATPSSSGAIAGTGLALGGGGLASTMALTGSPGLATAGVAPVSAGGGLGAAAAVALGEPTPVGEILLGLGAAYIIARYGAPVLKQALDDAVNQPARQDQTIVGYHAASSAGTGKILNEGFDLKQSDRSGRNRFGPGYYLSDTPAHAAAEYFRNTGRQPEAILQVKARLTKNMTVGGPFAERPISRLIGEVARRAGGSLTYGAFAPGAEGGINYVLFDPHQQVIQQDLLP